MKRIVQAMSLCMVILMIFASAGVAENGVNDGDITVLFAGSELGSGVYADDVVQSPYLGEDYSMDVVQDPVIDFENDLSSDISVDPVIEVQNVATPTPKPAATAVPEVRVADEVFESEPETYSVVYDLGDGDRIVYDDLEDGSVTPDFSGSVYAGEDRAFKGWSPEVSKFVTNDVVYSAVYENTIIKSKLSFWMKSISDMVDLGALAPGSFSIELRNDATNVLLEDYGDQSIVIDPTQFPNVVIKDINPAMGLSFIGVLCDTGSIVTFVSAADIGDELVLDSSNLVEATVIFGDAGQTYLFEFDDEPTPEPTEEPTPEPTEEPTPVPTEEPTPEPTEEPTPVPTEEPTPVPTEEPTPVPTEEPTPVPTEEPTPVPTEEPTPEPTAVPTVVPTVEPTAVPTVVPTAEPTAVPTVVPTVEPTAVPTVVPTVEPTAIPTAVPTVVPTEVPTVAPTAVPTEAPTSVPVQPTAAPTAVPTVEPTLSPTVEPTVEPTATPSIKQYTITFNSNGGSLVEPQIVEENKVISALPATNRVGFRFLGWFTELNGGQQIASIKAVQDFTVYAHWERIGFVVTFDSAGGSAVDPMVVTQGLNVSITAIPTREGYTFDGWYDAAKDGNKIESIVAMQDVTLYAHWTKVLGKFTVIYKDGVDGKAFTEVKFEDVTEGTATPKFGTSDPTYEGYTFNGWSPKWSDKVTKTVTYVAQWKPNDGSEGSGGSSGTSDSDDSKLSNDGKSDDSASPVKTADINLPLLIACGIISLAVLFGVLFYYKKRKTNE